MAAEQDKDKRFIEACLYLQEVMGKVSASVTHEIKNQLTVIKETAGLLQDLADMAGERGGLDPERVAKLGQRIGDRVVASDDIVKRYNRFAHSGDDPLGVIDPHQALDLMTAMHQRLADKRPVGLVYQPAAETVSLTTRPLFFLGAVFACLEAAVAACPDNGQVTARLAVGPEGARISFAWGPGGRPAGGPPAAVLALLGARLEDLPGGEGICLVAPRVGPDGGAVLG